MSGSSTRKTPKHSTFQNDDELAGDEYLKPIRSVSKEGDILKGDAEEADIAERDIADEDDEYYHQSNTAGGSEPKKPVNTRKRKKLEKLKEKKKRAKEMEREADALEQGNLHKTTPAGSAPEGAIPRSTNSLQYKIGYECKSHADFLNKKLSEFFCYKLSAIELADAVVTASHFVETSTTPVSSLIKQLHPTWKKSFRASEATLDSSNDADGVRGLPVVVIITGSAMRAANIYRTLNDFISIGHVGKLFAKHIKMSEHVELLHSKVMKIIVGTPHRILKLAESGELRFTRTKHLFIDGQLDQKSFSVFDVKDTKRELLALLQQFVIPCVQSGNLKLGITEN